MKKVVLVPPALRSRPARRPGAPRGNRNAFKHGRYTNERRSLYADIRAHIREAHALLEEFWQLRAETRIHHQASLKDGARSAAVP